MEQALCFLDKNEDANLEALVTAALDADNAYAAAHHRIVDMAQSLKEVVDIESPFFPVAADALLNAELTNLHTCALDFLKLIDRRDAWLNVAMLLVHDLSPHALAAILIASSSEPFGKALSTLLMQGRVVDKTVLPFRWFTEPGGVRVWLNVVDDNNDRVALIVRPTRVAPLDDAASTAKKILRALKIVLVGERAGPVTAPSSRLHRSILSRDLWGDPIRPSTVGEGAIITDLLGGPENHKEFGDWKGIRALEKAGLYDDDSVIDVKNALMTKWTSDTMLMALDEEQSHKLDVVRRSAGSALHRSGHHVLRYLCAYRNTERAPPAWHHLVMHLDAEEARRLLVACFSSSVESVGPIFESVEGKKEEEEETADMGDVWQALSQRWQECLRLVEEGTPPITLDDDMSVLRELDFAPKTTLVSSVFTIRLKSSNGTALIPDVAHHINVGFMSDTACTPRVCIRGVPPIVLNLEPGRPIPFLLPWPEITVYETKVDIKIQGVPKDGCILMMGVRLSTRALAAVHRTANIYGMRVPGVMRVKRSRILPDDEHGNEFVIPAL